ncbi:MAG: hypothetical protein JNK64_14090 [Myxococcales bacterium]|nr:hypothetical protein [Myxococcales bacterium]
MSSIPSSVASAAAGPLAVGAVITLRVHDPAPLVAVPAVVFAVAALTLPALYIATAVVGAAPPIGDVVRAVGRALHALGLVHLGLVLPLAFLVASSGPGTAFALGAITVATGAAIALKVLRAALFDDGAPAGRMVVLFWSWAAVALVIGGRLFGELMAEVVA